MSLCTPRDWQQIALREAAELLGTAEGAAKLAEAKRYGACADEVEHLQRELSDIREAIAEQCVLTECVSPEGPVRDVLQALQVWHARLGAEMERQASGIGVVLHPELIGVALDALVTPADDVGELP